MPSTSPAPAVATAAESLSRLLAQVALGDRRAFAGLYEAVKGELFHVVLRICRDRPLAEEVLQDVFVNIWRGARTYDQGRGLPMGWLVSVARYRAIDAMRERGGQVRTLSGALHDDGEDVLDTLPSDLPGPDEQHERGADHQQLHRCMNRLSAEQRQALALAYMQGYSHSEVAQHLAQPLGSVKSWVRRGLMALKRCLSASTALGA
jgi:RNA polymerase sigma-70 factor, ECF subfamily